MTRLVIYFLLLCEALVRCKRTNNNLQVILVSIMVQSLMIYPIISQFAKIEESGFDYFGAPFETNIGLMFPTIIALVLMMISVNKKQWQINELRFPLYSVVFFIVFSYLTPYNYSHYATHIFVFLFLQLWIVIYIVKTYLDYRQIIHALYDGLTIIVCIEFIVSLSYLLGFDTLQNFFLSNIEEKEWIREGTNVRRAYGTTFQPNRLGGLCAFIGTFFLSCVLNRFKKKKSIIMVAMSFLVIIMSQSRSALTAFVFSFLTMLYIDHYKKYGFSLQILFMNFAILAVLIGLFSTNIVGNMFFKSDVNDMENARMLHYVGGWHVLEKTNFTGVGLNAHVHYMYYKTDLSNIIGFWLSTHSIHSVHLVLFVETGIVGLLLWLYFLFSRIVRWIKTTNNKMNSPIIWTSFAGMLIIVFIHGFTDCLYLHYQYLLLLTLVGSYVQKKENSFLQQLGTKIA